MRLFNISLAKLQVFPEKTRVEVWKSFCHSKQNGQPKSAHYNNDNENYLKCLEE
jgi:hypothetical protein